MKKIAIALSSFFLLFSVLFGCVPTPEQEIVHKKDESQMIEEAQKPPITSESTVSEQVQAPEKWEKSTDEEQFHIRSNAPIIVPNCSAFPIYEVEAVPFTQVQVDILWNRLIGDQEMRDNQIDDSMLPKSQLAMMMQSEQERIEQFEHDEYYEENVQNAQERIKYYKSLYPTAPDDWIYTPATSEIREIVRRSSEDVCYIQGIDATNENSMTFQLFNDIFYEKNERNPIPFVQFLFRRERSTSQWISGKETHILGTTSMGFIVIFLRQKAIQKKDFMGRPIILEAPTHPRPFLILQKRAILSSLARRAQVTGHIRL